MAIFESDTFPEGLAPSLNASMRELASTRLTQSGRFEVVPHSQLRERLREQKMESYRECYDETCQIELGRELAANKILRFSLVQTAGTCRVTAQLLDLRKATIELAGVASSQCSAQEILDGVESALAQLLGQESGIGGEAAQHRTGEGSHDEEYRWLVRRCYGRGVEDAELEEAAIRCRALQQRKTGVTELDVVAQQFCDGERCVRVPLYSEADATFLEKASLGLGLGPKDIILPLVTSEARPPAARGKRAVFDSITRDLEMAFTELGLLRRRAGKPQRGRAEAMKDPEAPERVQALHRQFLAAVHGSSHPRFNHTAIESFFRCFDDAYGSNLCDGACWAHCEVPMY